MSYKKRTEEKPTPNFVDRTLMSLVVDASAMMESAQRVFTQVMSVAKDRGIEPPK
jgi:hypothetical protein